MTEEHQSRIQTQQQTLIDQRKRQGLKDQIHEAGRTAEAM